MNQITIFTNLITFFQGLVEDLCAATTWLWTPWDGLTAITGQEIAPIALFGSAAIIAILVFHIAHLINVVAG